MAKMISRRHFLRSSLAVGSFAAASLSLRGCGSSGGTANLLEAAQAAAPSANVEYLSVDPSQILPYTSLSNVDFSDYLGEKNSFTLPLGSLLQQGSRSQALVISPGESSRALISMGLVNLDSGDLTTLLAQALGHNSDYVIYDARAGDASLIWVECNMVAGLWRVYASTLLGSLAAADMQQAALLDEGEADYEPPLLAASGNKVYWTVMPDPNGPAYQQDSFLKCAQFSKQVLGEQPAVRVIYTSHGRMITNPQVSADTLTIVPRVDTDSVYYQLTSLALSDDTVRNVAILPPSLKVADAVWLGEGFAFSIEANYDYAQGLAYAGTYCQLSGGQYLYINKPPSAAPVRLGSLLCVKSSQNIVALDASRGNASIVPTPENGVDYGDILAAAGTQDRLVVYTTVTARIGQEKGSCQVRVLEALQGF